MASSFHDSALGSGSGSTTVPTGDTLAVTLGDLVWGHVKWETNTATCQMDTGAATPTFTTANAKFGTPFSSQTFCWTATSTGSITPRAVFSIAADFVTVRAISATPPGGTSLVLGNVAAAEGNSTAPNSGAASAVAAGVSMFGIGIFASVTNTPGGSPSSFTEPAEFSGSFAGHAQYFLQSGAGSITGASTISGANDWIAQLSIFDEVADATIEQYGFWWGVDDGNEASHTWETVGENTDITIAANQSRLLRVGINSPDDPAAIAYTLYSQKNGVGGYTAVPVGSTTLKAGTFFGGASGGANPTTSTTITIPASLPTSVVLSLHFTSRDHTNVTAQPTVSDNNGGAAWTQRQFSTDRKAQWWWKRYEAGLSGKTITISGAVGSLTARLVVIEDAYETGDPFTDFVEESNISGNETHAAITPTNANSAVVFAVYNYANDNAVTSVSAATTGAPGESTGHLSTGGSDCATHVAVWNGHPASSSGAITWAQTNGTTYSHVYACRSRTVSNECYIDASANITDGEATTARLTPPSGKTTSDFTAGVRLDASNGSVTTDIAANFYTELEANVALSSTPVNGDYFDFRYYNGSVALDTYGLTPRWTVGSGFDAAFMAAIVPRLAMQQPGLKVVASGMTPSNLVNR